MNPVDALIGALERAPAVVIPLVRQANPAVVKRRPAPGEWSIHENACHLAAVHPLFFDRLELMLATFPSPPGAACRSVPPPPVSMWQSLSGTSIVPPAIPAPAPLPGRRPSRH